jgi:hypothetical protein
MSRREKIVIPDALEDNIIIHFDQNASTGLKTMATKSGQPIKAFFLFGIHLAEIACQEYRKGNCVLVVDSAGKVLRALRPPVMIH